MAASATKTPTAIDPLRKLAASYWRPLVSILSVAIAVGNGVTKLGFKTPHFLTGVMDHGFLGIIIAIAVLVVIRFPSVAIGLTRAILGSTPPPSLLPRIFRGPRPYSSEDVEVFFGRQAVASDCWDLIQQNPFFILEGESGCGKSSLLNASLIPKARGKWLVVECRTAEDPFGKLYSRLTGKTLDDTDPDKCAVALAEAIATAKSAGPDNFPDAPLLLCIDQLEEIFITVRDEVRVRFFSVMKDAVGQGRMRLVLSVRSDFSDLVIEICRASDPSQKVLSPSNYYRLRAFSERQGQAVLMKMLEPVHENDLLRAEEIAEFSRAIVRDLLRSPTDKRLSRDDSKTVLPIELQTVGMMIEALPTETFSVKSLKRLGGTAGLMRLFVEDAKTYVWRKTGVSGDQSLLVLRQLISPAKTSWRRSPREISKNLNIPYTRARDILDAYADKYLVRQSISQPGETEGEMFELMHEQLVRIIAESPDRGLQRARDAEERLEFWQNRSNGVYSQSDSVNASTRTLKALFSQTIPLTEAIRLYPFASTREVRFTLRRNLLAASLRLLCVTLVFVVLPSVMWFLWDKSQAHEIALTLSELPSPEKVQKSVVPDPKLLAMANGLAMVGRYDLAVGAAKAISDRFESQQALLTIAMVEAEAGDPRSAIALMKGIKDRYDKRKLLVGLSFAGRLNESLDAMNTMDTEDKAYAISSIIEGLALGGHTSKIPELTRKAAETCHQIKDITQRLNALSHLATTLHRVNRSEESDIWKDACEQAAKQAEDSGIRGLALDLASADQHDLGLSVARLIPNGLERCHLLIYMADIEGKLTNFRQARLTWAESLSSCASVPQNLRHIGKDKALAQATSLALNGDRERSITLLRSLKDPKYEASSSTEIAALELNAADFADARWFIDNALRNTDSIKDSYGRDELHQQIVTLFARAGSVDETFKALRAFDHDSPATFVFDDALDGLLKARPAGATEEVWKGASSYAHSVEEPISRSLIIKSLVHRLSFAGEFQQALQEAGSMPYDPEKVSALVDIADSMSDKGLYLKAKELLDQALLVAQSLTPFERSENLAKVSIGYSHAHCFRLARLVCTICETGDKAEAYAQIVFEYGKARNPSVRINFKD
jgi:hypothetical protein